MSNQLYQTVEVVARPRPVLRMRPGGVWTCNQGAGQNPQGAYQEWKRMMERCAHTFNLRFEPPLV